MTALIIIFVILVLLVIYGVSSYNSFVRLKNKVEESNASLESQLKARYDLIPNLVETVKGYAKHESGTLENVIKARNAVASGAGEGQLEGALKSLFALSESYPELKADKNFASLQSQLSEIEKGILNARKYYNAVVKEYNIKRETFPSSLISSMFRFEKKEYVEVEAAAKERVEVKF